MPLIASGTAGTYTLTPEGSHPCVCCSVVDCGTQSSAYGERRTVLLRWELPDVASDDGPAVVSRFMRLSLNERANLRRLLETWRGRSFTAAELAAFDVLTVLGAPGLVQVLHRETGQGEHRAIVDSVTRLPTGLAAPRGTITPQAFVLAEASWQDYVALPEWIQRAVASAAEYPAFARRHGQQPQHDDDPRQHDQHREEHGLSATTDDDVAF